VTAAICQFPSPTELAARSFLRLGYLPEDMDLWTTLGPARHEIKAAMEHLTLHLHPKTAQQTKMALRIAEAGRVMPGPERRTMHLRVIDGGAS
jgi:hypothetical protein